MQTDGISRDQEGNASPEQWKLGGVGEFACVKRPQTTKEEKVTGKNLLSLIKRQGHRCAITRLDLRPQDAELDHIIPLSSEDGPGHVMSNVQIIHGVVNRMKGCMSHDDFISWCKVVANGQ